MTKLVDHFPAGCWRQPNGTYAGQCGCGASFDGATYAAAKTSWADHASTPDRFGEGYRAGVEASAKVADEVVDAVNEDGVTIYKAASRYTAREIATAIRALQPDAGEWA